MNFSSACSLVILLSFCGAWLVDAEFCADSKISFEQHFAHVQLDSSIQLSWSVKFDAFSEDWFMKTCLKHLVVSIAYANGMALAEQDAYYNKVTRGKNVY